MARMLDVRLCQAGKPDVQCKALLGSPLMRNPLPGFARESAKKGRRACAAIAIGKGVRIERPTQHRIVSVKRRMGDLRSAGCGSVGRPATTKSGDRPQRASLPSGHLGSTLDGCFFFRNEARFNSREAR